jgi:hypothetical protein
MFGICPQRRTGLLSWLFGNSKQRVAVFVDDTTGHSSTSDSNIIVKARSSYNLRPRRKAISYKEPEDPEDT